MTKQTAVVDLDAHKYAIAFAAEKRSVEVTHKTTKEVWSVANRSEWYGRGKTKDAGILAQINALRDSPYSWDEFEYVDIQKPEPLANILHTAKVNVERVVKASGASKADYFIGKGESFRVGRSTLLKYKGAREASIKPIMLGEVSEYLIKRFSAEVITDIEVDDKITMECWLKPDKFVILEDKDGYGSGVKIYNFNKPEEGIINTNCFGKLWRDSKGKVRGVGRMFKLWQVCSNDTIDHYKANCFSDVKWGDVSAYEALVNSQNDIELMTNALQVFQKLYPEPKVVTGWRGDEIEIDALYVFQEMMDMAHMHRWEDDWVNVREVLDKMRIKY